MLHKPYAHHPRGGRSCAGDSLHSASGGRQATTQVSVISQARGCRHPPPRESCPASVRPRESCPVRLRYTRPAPPPPGSAGQPPALARSPGGDLHDKGGRDGVGAARRRAADLRERRLHLARLLLPNHANHQPGPACAAPGRSERFCQGAPEAQGGDKRREATRDEKRQETRSSLLVSGAPEAQGDTESRPGRHIGRTDCGASRSPTPIVVT